MAPPNGIDLSNPDVRLFLRLVRLQVLTPLAVLINLATVLVCSFVVHPSISQVSREHATAITPSAMILTLYWALLSVSQIGFCVLLVFARSQETKQALVSLGLSLVLANWLCAAWAVAWVLQFFVASTIFLGLIVLLLLYANFRLLLRSSVATLWEIAFIHVPVRLFFVAVFTVDFWQSLFIAIGHTWDPAEIGKPAWQWETVFALIGTNTIGLLIVIFRADLVWTFGACLALLAVAFGPYHTVPVLVTTIVFLVLFPLALLASLFWKWSSERREGAIALPADEENGHGHAHPHAEAATQTPAAAPEVDEEVQRLRIRMEAETPTTHGESSQHGNHYQQRHQQPPTPVEESVWG